MFFQSERECFSHLNVVPVLSSPSYPRRTLPSWSVTSWPLIAKGERLVSSGGVDARFTSSPSQASYKPKPSKTQRGVSPVTCHLSPATCHLSPATCHLPPATLSPATEPVFSQSVSSNQIRLQIQCRVSSTGYHLG